MSKFLEIPAVATTPMCLHKEAQYYILDEFRPNLDKVNYTKGHPKGKEEQLIQSFIDKAGGKLRMYGSAKELLENVEIYRSFPASHAYFNNDEEPYQTPPTIYKSLKNEEKFIAKSDLFVILQNMIIDIRPDCGMELVTLVACHLKTQEERGVSKVSEFVKFDEKLLGKIRDELNAKLSKISRSEIQQAMGLVARNLSKAKMIEKFESLSPGTYGPKHPTRQLRLTQLLETFSNELDQEMRSFALAMLITLTESFTEALQGVISSRPELFSPHAAAKSKAPITVRLFEDGDQQFVMKSELSDALILNSTIRRPLDDLHDIHFFFTMSLDEVHQKYDTRNIEFIRYPILRAKHKAVPIRGSAPSIDVHDHFVLAVDGLFEFLRDLIYGLKFFQRFEISDDFFMFFNSLNRFFKSDRTRPYFFRIVSTIVMKAMAKEICLGTSKNEQEVRDAKADGFTVQSLKNELEHLGLTTTFPEIRDFAESVYSEVDKKKKEPVLRTCDLFDAIEHCVLICVFERLPNYKKFLHNQKGCHRVYGLKCDACEKENQKIQKTSECVEIENLKKELSKLKIDHEKLLEDSKMETENLQKKIQNLEHRNLKLSIENQTNGEKMAQLGIEQENEKYSNPVVACTSNSIQCLICDVQIDNDDVIRCPLCKRRFHQKCAFEWLKEHTQCPACNGDLSSRI